MTTKQQMPKLYERAEFIPGTYNADRRTVDFVFSTGHRGRRRTWLETYDEELVISEEAIRMERLNSGAPLLDAHGSWSMADQWGVVDRAWVEAGKLCGTVRFSTRPEVQPFVDDVAAGIIRNCSVGYVIHSYEKIEGAEGKIPLYRALDWEPYEVSLVPIGFDPGAQTRAAEAAPATLYDVEVITRSATLAASGGPLEETMTTPNTTARGADAAAPTPEAAPAPAPASPEAIRAAEELGATRERARVTEIRRAVRAARLGDELAETLIAEGASVDAARARVIEQFEQADAGTTSNVRIVRDAGDTMRTAMTEAIEARVRPATQVSEASRNYRGMTLMEMARDYLESTGVSTRGLGRMEVASLALGNTRAVGMLGTSDFPLILANVVNKTLRAAYEAAPQTFRPLVREVSASDFKTIQRTQMGDAPRLEKVAEGGPFTRGAIGEAAESYKIETFGRIVAITRQALINDDLSAFDRLPAMFGRAAADLESKIVWDLIINNVLMADGLAVFHATHANLGTAALIGVDSVGEGRKLMRQQKGLNGELINVTPKYLIVPSSLETKAEQFLTTTAVMYAKQADANPFASKLQLVAEPRLDAASATAWYLAADPASVDTIEIAYLEGQRGLYTETRQGFEVDGVEVKARLDFGAAVIDHRGLVKNAGL